MGQIQRNYGTEDVVRAIEATSTWSYIIARCFSCHQRVEAETCNTPRGHLCIQCAATEFRASNEKINFSKWPVSKFLAALSPKGRLRWRLMLLWRSQEMLSIVAETAPAQNHDFRLLLVQNLGYVEPHPLAQWVRQAACHACVQLGETILPLVLKMQTTKDWRFYTNIVIVAGKIAPADPAVRTLLEQASASGDPIVRTAVLTALNEHDSRWARDLLEVLRRDLDLQVRFLAVQVNKNWKVNHKKNSAQLTRQQPLPVLNPEEKEINTTYSDSSLRKIHAQYLKHILADSEFEKLCEMDVDEIDKTDLVRALAAVFTQKILFDKFYAILPDDVKEIFQALTWEGKEYDGDKLQEMFQNKIYKTGYRIGNASADIKPGYLIFQIKCHLNYQSVRRNAYKYVFKFSDRFQKIFRQLMPVPNSTEIVPLDQIEKTDFIYENNGRILAELSLFASYMSQKKPEFSSTGDKLLKSYIVQMQQYCSIDEFYPKKDNNLNYLRSQLIINFLIESIDKDFDNTPVFFKHFITNFFNYQNFKLYELKDLLYFVKGIEYDIFTRQNRNIRSSIYKLLKNLPPSQWFSIANIIQYAHYARININPVNRKSAYYHLNFQRFIQDSHSYIQNPITEDNYNDVIITPFIKGVMFFFAAFGMLDIAYNLPVNEKYRTKKNQYLSIYDGLQYVRLTKLGAYVLDLSTEYELEYTIESAKISLDTKRLMIDIQGNDLVKRMALDRIGEKINENCYKINFKSFLKDCHSKTDIKKKVELFKKQICENPPQIWEDFLVEINHKIDPLKNKPTMQVFQLKQHKELISLFAKDEILKKITFKAEDYHIIVAESNVKRIRKRLEEFGYFIENI